MSTSPAMEASGAAWTLRKAVTTLAISPQTASLTRTGRMAYNVMLLIAQQSGADVEGGYSAPISSIVKGFDSTTRDSHRVRTYIEQMCGTVVRWYPLSASDEAQASLLGVEPLPAGLWPDGRIFSLLSEARMYRRAGEQWVTWYYPPSIQEMLMDPARWAQCDIKEMSKLDLYGGVALYEICARYKDAPGGLTNRHEPETWMQVLRGDSNTKPREWRKFKYETLNPAIAEINRLTSLDIELIEHKKGRATVSVQFVVRRKAPAVESGRVDLRLVESAAQHGIKERELDQLVDDFGEQRVQWALAAMEGRLRNQPSSPIPKRLNYLRATLRNGAVAPITDEVMQPSAPVLRSVPVDGQGRELGGEDWLAARVRAFSQELESFGNEEIERLAELALAALPRSSPLDLSLRKRFVSKQYRSPMIWRRIVAQYAAEKHGENWDKPDAELRQDPSEKT